jgi:hypothetical protein
MNRQLLYKKERDWDEGMVHRVLIGVGPPLDDGDQGIVIASYGPVRRMLRKLSLGDSWSNSFLNGRGQRTERPWLTRTEAEQFFINTEIANNGGCKMPGITGGWQTGLAAERIVNLLIEDKVLRHPFKTPCRNLRTIRSKYTDNSEAKVGKLPINPGHYYEIHQPTLFEWLAVRFLLLEEDYRDE